MKKKSSVKVAIYNVKIAIKYSVNIELLLLHALEIRPSTLQAQKRYVQHNIDEVALRICTMYIR